MTLGDILLRRGPKAMTIHRHDLTKILRKQQKNRNKNKRSGHPKRYFSGEITAINSHEIVVISQLKAILGASPCGILPVDC